MRLQRIFFVLVLVVMSNMMSLLAEQRSETLRTRQGDEVLLRYDITHTNDQVIIRLTHHPVITLSSQHRQTYGDAFSDNKLKCLYFEKSMGKYGGKKQQLDLNGLQPSPMRISKADLTSSDWNGYGYVELEKDREVMLTLNGGSSPHLDIPIYLALYKGKNKLQLIDMSTRSLSIDLTKPEPKSKVRPQQPTSQPVTTNNGVDGEVRREPIYEERDVPAPMGDMVEAGDMGAGGGVFSIQQQIDRVRNMLAREKGEDLSDEVNKAMDDLAALYSTCSPEEKSAIDNLRAEVNQKGAELQQAAQAAKAEEEKRQQDEENKVKEDEDNQKKRNIWLMIGGALLAVLLFVGNQVMQHVRNRSQVRSMQELQDRAMHQAEGQIKQRTRSMVQQQMGKAEQAVVRTASGSLRAVRGSAEDHAAARVSAKSPEEKPSGDKPLTGRIKAKPKDRSKETLQEKAERAARGARIRKHRDSDGNLSI